MDKHQGTLRIRLYVLRKGLHLHSYSNGIGTPQSYYGGMGEWTLRESCDAKQITTSACFFWLEFVYGFALMLTFLS